MRHTLILCLLVSACHAGSPMEPDPHHVRVAVIGGMTMTGMWPAVAALFEADTGLKVHVVATGPRPRLDAAFRAGRADLLTMHSGDITTDLVADGYGRNMRPWTRNDVVIVGPPSDPARIKGLADGAEAFRRIAAAKAPFVDFHGIGSRETAHRTADRAGVERKGAWILKDETEDKRRVLLFAEERKAYVIVGRMPVLWGKMPRGTMEIMVESDPAMRRPYIVMEANPARLPHANHEGARKLADFLLSDKAQAFLKTFGAKEHGGIPLFHPVWSKSRP